MRFSLNWLQNFFSEPLANYPIDDLLTKAGLEVDSMTPYEPRFEGVLIAKVEEVNPHPNADKLCVATVNSGEENLQVVCGASNCKAGLITAFAPIGCVLIDLEGKKHKIKKGSLRGVESFGMLLSAEELGLNEKSDGIIELDETFQVGDKLKPYFKDTLLEISFTPNLGYAMSHLGVSRELSALIQKPFALPSTSKAKLKNFKTSDHVQVSVSSQTDCPAYGALLIKNVSIKPSPLWLKLRLEACGLKSINNVVDITNYLLHELGQPLHAFDFDLIEGNQVQVKKIEKEMEFETLDKEKRKLPKETLMIWDQKKPIAIAGVMGGINSEVNSQTKNILLEAAHFSPKLIRKMSKKLNLYTEASKHFERGVDPTLFKKALQRAGDLIAQVASGEVSEEILTIEHKPSKEKKVSCRLKRIHQLLGISFSKEQVASLFKRLNLPFKEKEGVFEVSIPAYRFDLNIEEDLIDEVARIYGLDLIKSKDLKYTYSEQEDSPHYQIEEKLHNLLLGEGLQEVLSCDLISPEMNALVNEKNQSIQTLNYMSRDLSQLRLSLLPNHLSVLKHNQDHQNSTMHLYEIGQVYQMHGECYDESTSVQITLMGRRSPYHYTHKENPLNFFHLKGILENLFHSLLSQKVFFEKSEKDFFHPQVQAKIFAEDEILGYIGEVHPSLLRKAGLKQAVFTAELFLNPLIKLSQTPKKYTPISPFPSSERDWTFTSLDELEIGHLIKAIKSIPSRILKDVYLLDIYRNEKIGLDNKNVTLRFVYRNDKKTLSFEAIEVEHARIISDVQAKMKTLIIEPT